MRIAVTGGTGFLGRYILRELAGLGHDLRCWYRPGSDRGGLDEVAAHLDWQPGQLGDVAAARALVRGTDAVVHAALQWERSTADGRRTSGDANLVEFLDTNLMGSLRLFIEARNEG